VIASRYIANHHIPVLTKPVTLSSISLSLRPLSNAQVSFALSLPKPESTYHLKVPSSPFRTLQTTIISHNSSYLILQHTISRPHPRLRPQCLSDHNRCVWVVLLHGWIGARKDCVENNEGAMKPGSGAMVGSLAEQEADFLQ